ncbi:MAG TPA: glycosyltransferase [Bacteroidia bacterium]|nr:glycosyltransferase [Bacteroidia bacterium]
MKARKKNILLIPSWYPGKADPVKGLFIKKHAIEIARLNHVEVIYFEFIKDKGIENNTIVQNESSDIDLTETIFPVVLSTNPFRMVLSFIKMNWIVWRYIRKSEFHFDIIHLHVIYPTGVFLFPVIWLNSLPMVITEHWSGYFHQDGRYFSLSSVFRKMIKRIFSKSNAVTVVSEPLGKRIADEFGIGEKIHLISNVISLPNELLTQNRNVGPVTALTVCTFDDHAKNITGMIKAVKEIVQLRPDFRLVIAGDGPDKQKILEEIARNQISSKNIILTGYINEDEIVKWRNKADFYLLNSFFETFSIGTAEALLSGLPVISTRCQGPETYITEKEGILIEPGNQEKLVDALLKMIDSCRNYNPSEIRNAVRNRLRLDDISESFDKLYDSIMN